jgi:hypothetical protein
MLSVDYCSLVPAVVVDVFFERMHLLIQRFLLISSWLLLNNRLWPMKKWTVS